MPLENQEKMITYYNILFRKLGIAKTTEWGIAIRKACNYNLILNRKDEHSEPFMIIPSTNEYWYADPLLFSDNGKTWLFVEAYNRERRKGEIGVFDIVDGEAVNFRQIISIPTHMSYPFVFKYQQEYYMIPETGAAEEIILYKANAFPDKWTRDKVLLSGKVYRDSTVYQGADGKLKVLSYRQTGSRRYNVKYYLTVFDLDMESKTLSLVSEIVDKKKINRPAGPVISIGDKKYRVGQKCSRVYGESIYSYEMKNIDKPIMDKRIGELSGNMIRLDREGIVILLHTYSQAGGHEVIDYRCQK